MRIINSIFHNKFIYDRRMKRLYTLISSLISKYKCFNILDIGAGDGKIDRMLMDNLDVDITGIDVLVRDKTYIPVSKYNGKHIDLPDNSVNTTMLIDVLHHADNPAAVFNEAVRVASDYIIVKDHILHGTISYIKLKLMDYVGNKHYSVRLPYNYLSKASWKQLFKDNDLKVIGCKTNLNLYTGLFHILFDSNLHFIVILKKDVK